MTVAELIARLQEQPQHIPVKVLLSEVAGVQRRSDGSIDTNDDAVMDLELSDAIEAHYVRFEGNYVLIESK